MALVAEVSAPVHLEPGRQQLRVLRQLHVEGLAEPRHIDVDHALADAVSLRSAPRRAPVQIVGEEVSAGVDERWNDDVEVWEKKKKKEIFFLVHLINIATLSWFKYYTTVYGIREHLLTGW